MRRLALDISTKTGYALFEDDKLLEHGTLRLDKKVESFGEYPKSYYLAASAMCDLIDKLIQRVHPEEIVIEETNKGKNRYTQKILEFTHCCVIEWCGIEHYNLPLKYINTSDWRKTLGIIMPKEYKKLNAKLSRETRKAKDKGTKLDKKALGIRGKKTVKHLAIEWANSTYNLQLKMKDNDQADAIALLTAYLRGAPICNGRD